MSEGSRLEQAIALAVSAHAGQVDKAGAPYILHPLRVMLAVEGEEARIAAVLHDSVEDRGIALAEIRERFGSVVAEAVDALSRREGERYEAFIARCAADPIARIVKAADLGDNMDTSRLATITAKDEARLAKYLAAAEQLATISATVV